MAYNKTIQVPGFGVTASYIRVDRVSRLDQLARDAEFVYKIYVNKEVASKPGCQGFAPGAIRVICDAFDLYFSKAALSRSPVVDIYARAYQLIADYQLARLAVKARDTFLADPKNKDVLDKAPDVDASQRILVSNVFLTEPDLFDSAEPI